MKRYYSQKQLDSFKNFKRNVIGDNKRVAGVLRNKEDFFYKTLKEYRRGGINSQEMRSIIGEIYQNTKDPINKKGAIILAQEILGGSRHMIRRGNRLRRADMLREKRNAASNRLDRRDLTKSPNSSAVNTQNSDRNASIRSKGHSGIKLVC
ncbi:MAG: hypothetical protein RBR98_01485 [Candidatus Moranbacteria bacterium]|jgi:hypothetical protein|nr:hypothetical protein [Candidatus Moranbacteria bacterium]